MDSRLILQPLTWMSAHHQMEIVTISVITLLEGITALVGSATNSVMTRKHA